MAFAIKATLQAVESYLLKSGYLARVQVGEPKQPPAGGTFSAAVFMAQAGVAMLTLGTTIERHDVTVRLYRNMLDSPTEDIEFESAALVQKIGADLLGEYDLGATIRNVDAGGQHGPPLSARWGYVDVGGMMYRIVDIALGLIVDDSATLAA